MTDATEKYLSVARQDVAAIIEDVCLGCYETAIKHLGAMLAAAPAESDGLTPSKLEGFSAIAQERDVGKYEHFRDAAYYDLWCVQRVGERGFGVGWHLHTEAEAKSLIEALTTSPSAISEAPTSAEAVIHASDG